MKKILLLATFCFMTQQSFSQSCVVVKGGKEEKFDGSSLSGLSVEKKSLSTLNKTFPQLNVTEKVFSGAMQACTSCSDNFVKCQ